MRNAIIHVSKRIQRERKRELGKYFACRRRYWKQCFRFDYNIFFALLSPHSTGSHPLQILETHYRIGKGEKCFYLCIRCPQYCMQFCCRPDDLCLLAVEKCKLVRRKIYYWSHMTRDDIKSVCDEILPSKKLNKTPKIEADEEKSRIFGIAQH